VQEALLATAAQWPAEGVPGNPRGWLITVASRRLTDMLRAEQARTRREETVARQVPPSQNEPDRDHPPFPALTRREREVLFHLAKGSGLREVARQLHMSSKTVNTHLQNLRSKLGVHSTLEAVALARSRLDQWFSAE